MAFIGYAPVIAHRLSTSSTVTNRSSSFRHRTPTHRPCHITYAPLFTCQQSEDSTTPPTPSSSTSATTATSTDSTSENTSSPSTTPSTSPTASSSTRPDPVRVAAADISKEEAHKFRQRYEHLRGADIETVSDAMDKFTSTFQRPLPIVYRTIINEMISTTHLARVCSMWKYDVIFAFGFNAVFTQFLKYYPNEDELAQLYDSIASCLTFNKDKLRKDSEGVELFLENKTEDDLFNLLDSDSKNEHPLINDLITIRDAGYGDWYYSKLFGIGLIQIMSILNVELNAANAEKWASKIGIETSKFGAEMGNYLSALERLKQAEQIFAEATAREAKKTAERLAAKAKRAADAATKLENPDLPQVESNVAASSDTETVADDSKTESASSDSSSSDSPKA